MLRSDFFFETIPLRFAKPCLDFINEFFILFLAGVPPNDYANGAASAEISQEAEARWQSRIPAKA